MKYTSAIVLISLLSCCTSDYQSRTEVMLNNSTKYKIELIPYQYGIVDSNRILNIAQFSQERIELASSLGKSTAPFAFGEYFIGLDSVIVNWEGNHKVNYLGKDYITSSKAITIYDSTNNFFIETSFESKLVKDHKKYSLWTQIFTFTEADYEYAKE